MANSTIQIKRSGTATNVPSALAYGELAINYADGILYYKNATNHIVAFTSGGGDSFSIINANGTLLVADVAQDVFYMNCGSFIEIVGDGVSDALTISANVKPVYDLANIAPIAFGRANIANNLASLAYIAANAAFDKANLGGAALVTISATPPVSPTVGEMWWNSVLGLLAIRYKDTDDEEYWVEAAPSPTVTDASVAVVFGVANAAYDKANTGDPSVAFGVANAAFDRANTANTVAATVFGVSNSAFDRANTANGLASQAFDRANTANTLAATVFGVSNSAFDRANTANTVAATVFDVSNTAFDRANTANTLAATVFGVSNSAFDRANTANGLASQAFDRGNIANTMAATVFGVSNTSFTHANNAYAKANSANLLASNTTIGWVIDGQGSVITTGTKGHIELPYNCIIKSYTILGDVTGNVKLDLYVAPYAAYPPTSSNSLTGGTGFTIPGANTKNTGIQEITSTLMNVGEIVTCNVVAVNNFTKLTVSIKVTKS